MRLYDIDQAFYDWLDEVEANDGEITPELKTELDCIQAEFGHKVEGYVALIKEFEHNKKRLAEEKARIEGRRKTYEHTEKWLRDNLAASMRLLQRDKYKSPKWTVWLQKDVSVSVEDVTALPEEFIKTERTPLKGEIKAAIDAGREVPGAVLEEKEGVRIR